jgi:hypothetical protein
MSDAKVGLPPLCERSPILDRVVMRPRRGYLRRYRGSTVHASYMIAEVHRQNYIRPISSNV